MFQIADYTSYAYVVYSLVVPMFTLYFIQTERDNGKEWDGFFWMFLQTIVSVLVMMMVVYGQGGYLISVVFTAQNIVLIVMLLISSKKLSEIVGFLLATLFPILTALSGMIFYDLRLQGAGLSMMLTDTEGNNVTGQAVDISGESYQLNAVFPDGAVHNVTWTSSNTQTAVVNNRGLVTFTAYGTVTINAVE